MSYLVIFYPVSAGQNGPLLGSDEEEIVLLVFIVIDVKSNQIVAEKRYTVKPRTADINENVLSEQCRNEFGLSEDQVKRGELLETVIEMFDEWIRRFLASPSGRNSKALSAAESDDASGDLSSPTSSSPTFSSATSTSYGYSREPEAWIGPTITLVCDGQLPLRQCFHPEACNKNIEVPHYYYSFFDLRKEFKKSCNSEEVHGVREMMTALGKDPLIIQGDQAAAEAESMAIVVRDMLDKGYQFVEPETISARLEPGICSKSEVIDNNCVVRARGLPWQSSDQDIARFFRGLNVAK